MTIQISDHFTLKKLFKFVLPTVIMMVVTSVYTVIDGLFVSNFVGKTPFAAINIIVPFVMILGGTGFMIGTGGTALVTKVLGEGDDEKAKSYFTLLILFTVALGLVLTAVGIAVTEPVARLLGANDDMIEPCVLYGRICVGFTAFFMLQGVFHSFLSAAGKPKIGLVVTLSAGATNAVFDALFIVVFKWGVAGAAIATGLGQFMGGVVPLIYFARKNSSLLRFTKPKFELKAILQSCFNGSSEFLTNLASSIVSIVYNLQLMKYLGEDGVSAYGVIMYFQFVFLAIEIGYSIGTAPIIGFNYGAENHAELKNIFKKSIVIMGCCGVILSALAQALAIPLSKLFVGYDKELYDLTVHAFRLFSFSFVFSGINILSSGFFTALNNGAVSAILSFLRALAYQIIFIFALPALMQVDGIWLANVATEVCAFITAVIFFIAYRKRYRYI